MPIREIDKGPIYWTRGLREKPCSLAPELIQTHKQKARRDDIVEDIKYVAFLGQAFAGAAMMSFAENPNVKTAGAVVFMANLSWPLAAMLLEDLKGLLKAGSKLRKGGLSR